MTNVRSCSSLLSFSPVCLLTSAPFLSRPCLFRPCLFRPFHSCPPSPSTSTSAPTSRPTFESKSLTALVYTAQHIHHRYFSACNRLALGCLCRHADHRLGRDRLDVHFAQGNKGLPPTLCGDPDHRFHRLLYYGFRPWCMFLLVPSFPFRSKLKDNCFTVYSPLPSSLSLFETTTSGITSSPTGCPLGLHPFTSSVGVLVPSDV